MGLQRKTGAGIKTQAWQPHGREEKRETHAALAEWGPCGADTADGAGSLNHGLLLLFLRWYPRLGRGRRKDSVHLWVF